MTVKDYGSTTQPANVQVIAPATLSAGYTFDALYEGKTFTVTVPEGGVVKGQRFIVPFIPPAVAEATPIAKNASLIPPNPPNTTGEDKIPTGAWRDALCDCCQFGPCHPSLLIACFCRPILVAQLLTRMKMTWLGQRTHFRNSSANLSDSRTEVDQRWKRTFCNVILVLVLSVVLLTIVFPAPVLDDPTDPDAYDNLSFEEQRNLTINKMLSALFGFYFFYTMVQLRATMRHVYSIPEERCLCLYCGGNPTNGICCSGDGRNMLCSAGVPVGWEDVCCAMCCPCCITSQMARHTVDYDYRRATCCDSVGVSNYMDDEAYEGIENGALAGEGNALIV